MATKEGWIKRKERYGESGSKNPEETRKKFLGRIAWNKGMKGYIHSGSFKKGRIVPESICKSISEGNKGKPKPLLSKVMKGKHNSPKTEFQKGLHYNKLTEFQKGSISWNKRIDEDKVIKLYQSKESVINISNILNCSYGAIYFILKKHHIKLRDKPTGKESWSWKGGKSFEPYDKSFNNKFKRAIRKRDNYVCVMCGIHSEKLNRALDVHHINYDKFLTIPQNCISLCKKCHIKTNFNRIHWIKFFQDLLKVRYNYTYSNEEILIKIPGGKICSS